MKRFFRKSSAAPPRAVLPESERMALAVIGVGQMGRHHVRLLAQNHEVRLLGIVDPQISRAESLARQYGSRAFADASELPSEVEAVVVAAPTPYHYELTKAFLSRGCHCFVEKPLTQAVEEAEELIETARQKNLVLQAGHIERFNPAVVEMVRHVRDPLFIEANRLGPYDPRVSHVGVVLDLMIHDIDIVLALVRDRVVRLEAIGASLLSSHEDIVKATLHFSRGCRADLTVSRMSLQKYRKIRVFQKDAYLSLDYSDRSLKICRKKRPLVKSLLDIAVQHPSVEKSDALETELRHFIQCVREGKAPLVGGEHGRDALEIALEIRRAMAFHAL